MVNLGLAALYHVSKFFENSKRSEKFNQNSLILAFTAIFWGLGGNLFKTYSIFIHSIKQSVRILMKI